MSMVPGSDQGLLGFRLEVNMVQLWMSRVQVRDEYMGSDKRLVSFRLDMSRVQ